jgi:hypothetical protein
VKPQKITEEGYLIMTLKDQHFFTNRLCSIPNNNPLSIEIYILAIGKNGSDLGYALTNKVQRNILDKSVRATMVNLLTHCGVPDKEIIRITGHKCEASLSFYNADLSDNQKKRYSAILSSTKFLFFMLIGNPRWPPPQDIQYS